MGFGLGRSAFSQLPAPFWEVPSAAGVGYGRGAGAHRAGLRRRSGPGPGLRCGAVSGPGPGPGLRCGVRAGAGAAGRAAPPAGALRLRAAAGSPGPRWRWAACEAAAAAQARRVRPCARCRGGRFIPASRVPPSCTRSRRAVPTPQPPPTGGMSPLFVPVAQKLDFCEKVFSVQLILPKWKWISASDVHKGVSSLLDLLNLEKAYLGKQTNSFSHGGAWHPFRLMQSGDSFILIIKSVRVAAYVTTFQDNYLN